MYETILVSPSEDRIFFNMVVFYYHNIDTENRRCILAYMSKSVLDRFAVDRLNNSLGLQIASFIIKGV